MDLGNKIWENVNQDLMTFDQSTGSKIIDALKGAKLDSQKEIKYNKISALFRRTIKDMPNGTEGLNVSLFHDLVYNPANRKMLIKEFGEDTLRNMESFADMAMIMSSESAKRAMSDAQKYIGAPLVGGGGIAAAIYNPWLAVPHGMAPVFAYSMMKPSGVFKAWLTEGLSSAFPTAAAATKGGLMIGGRAAISNKK
jgi:hypothetical protein